MRHTLKISDQQGACNSYKILNSGLSYDFAGWLSVYIESQVNREAYGSDDSSKPIQYCQYELNTTRTYLYNVAARYGPSGIYL